MRPVAPGWPRASCCRCLAHAVVGQTAAALFRAPAAFTRADAFLADLSSVGTAERGSESELSLRSFSVGDDL